MAKTFPKLPDVVQAIDVFKDRIYYKVQGGFIFTSHRELRRDRLEEWKQWNITCDKLPDVILVNGQEFKLVEVKE